MGVGLDLESADRVGARECVCVPVYCESGEAPFHSPKARAGPRGLQRALLPLSMGEAQPGRCDLPGPRPGWRKTRRVGLGSRTLLFLSRLPSAALEGPPSGGP